MENNLDCDVFLLLSKEKMIISVNSELNKNVYREELKHNQNLEALISDIKNIFA